MREEGVFVRVHVTSDDIRMGQRCLGARCPIALAFGRVVGGPVYVTPKHLTALPKNDEDQGAFYAPPEWVGRWIYAFDHLEDVDAISFEAKLMTESEVDALDEFETMVPQ